MKAIILVTTKYWKKHPKSAAALLFSGVLLIAIVFASLMTLREECVRFYENAFDNQGHYEILIANSDDELLLQALNGSEDYDYAAINVFGKLGYRDKQFTYGTISDQHNLWHMPLNEGRMPEAANEIAAPRAVLDACYWIGECGDTITLNDTEYTVVGIIDDSYAAYREGSELCADNSDKVLETGYYIPLIFVGECSAQSLYRIDLIGDFFDFSGLSNGLYDTNDDIKNAESIISEYSDYLYSIVGRENHWIGVNSEHNAWYTESKTGSVNFLMTIAWIGAAVSLLSVFSVLRGIFIERRTRISTLKRIGTKRRQLAVMYIFECAAFAVVQTVIGIAAGIAAYGGIHFVRTSVLGEKPYSAFTDIGIVYQRTLDPFLYAGIISFVVIAFAYFINILTVNARTKAAHKRKKPLSLSGGFRAAMRQSGITSIQIISLTLICFSVIVGYMYYTDNGKESTMWLSYINVSEDYKANGFSMEKNGIEEYYHTNSVQINCFGEDGLDLTEYFPLIAEDYSGGFDDSIAKTLPESAIVTGVSEETFIASVDALSGLVPINLSNSIVRETFIDLSDDEYKDFFDEGSLGSENLYRIPTKLTVAHTIDALSEYVTDGEISLSALENGDEILLIYNSNEPPFNVGETITIYSAFANENGYGIGEIQEHSVKIGAAVKLPSSLGELETYAVKSDYPCNFLTTASGAEALGLSSAYTEVYSSEKLGGGVFPQSAEMQLISLSEKKLESALDKAMKFAGTALILVVMTLLGFAAYFNGIGLKIRQKSYQISVFRAIGMPLRELRRRIFLQSVKIPIISSATAYALLKILQFIMEKSYNRLCMVYQGEASALGFENKLRSALFLDNVMWQVNIEIPMLILFVLICTITFILTGAALKKFNADIAGNLKTEGRSL